MTRSTSISVNVQWGDCDPADIVFFPNFNRWMDASAQHFFTQCGVPRWRELETTRGIVGTPLLEINTKFYKPATYGDHIEVHTCVEEWRAKGDSASNWMFQALAYLGDDRRAKQLTPIIRDWPASNGQAKALMGLEILAAIGTDTALAQIQAIARKNKYPNRRSQGQTGDLALRRSEALFCINESLH